MKAMLLAAGRGERMGQLTASHPKSLLSLGTETLIGRHLRRFAEAGISEVVINLSYRGDAIRKAVGVTSDSSTLNCSTIIVLTFSSTEADIDTTSVFRMILKTRHEARNSWQAPERAG